MRLENLLLKKPDYYKFVRYTSDNEPIKHFVDL
jgi:hypothetical protein